MADESDEFRDALHLFLQERGLPDGEPGVLVGWALVTDWVGSDDTRRIAKAHSPSIASWGAVGLHHEAIYGDWDDDEMSTGDDG